jgi:hypothetical protein
MTCGGCHALSDNGFQIDPIAQGDSKLSRFLVDPSKPMDEMRRRIEWMQHPLAGAVGEGLERRGRSLRRCQSGPRFQPGRALASRSALG